MSLPPGPDVLRLRQSVSAMGTTFSIALHGRDRDRMEAAVGTALGEITRLDRLLSNHRPDSEWSLVNSRAGHEPVTVSLELFEFLAACLAHGARTDGAFDITVGPLKRAWSVARANGIAPALEAVAAARRHVGHRLVEIDAATRRVRFDHPGVELDPGGAGKGYAVDRVVHVLRSKGFDTALVAGSKSSIFGMGTPPERPEGWRADIQHPEHLGQGAVRVFLRDTSLTTSGTAEQAYWVEGRMFSHLLDPRTGWPLQEPVQVSAIAPSALDGEIWGKACLLNGRAWASAHKPEGVSVLFFPGEPGQPPTWMS